MSPATVLDTLFRITRSRKKGTRAPFADTPSMRRALRSLARHGLVRLTARGPELTLVGFAVAVAASDAMREKRSVRRSSPREGGKLIPLVRRRRAA